jgi:RND family efflux transporter MFP subunit
VASELVAEAPTRPGIFTPSGAAPPAGDYTLLLRYRFGTDEALFECGSVSVSDTLPAAEPARAAIGFLKEQQWSIPFATALASERDIAHEVELPAAVEPAGTDQLTIAAPTSGRFYHNPKLSLAEGLHVEAGTLVGLIAPTVAGDDFNRLTSAVDEARLEKRQAAREVARLEPLVADGLLPDKRLIEANNQLEAANAKLSASGARLGRVTAPGGKGGLEVKASLEGVVTELLVANGEPVEPGAALLRIGGENTRWIRARFVTRPDEELHDATAVAVRTTGGQRIDVRKRARLLSEHPIVDPKTQLATWIAQVNMGDEKTLSTHTLRSGSPVVLLLRVGKPTSRLTVPRSAVEEINTRTYVFVQVGGEQFEKRRVVLGDADGDYVHVLEGVAVGERVVTRGGYDIHLASVIGSVESHRH